MLLATHAEEWPASIVRTCGPKYAISIPSRVIFAIRSMRELFERIRADGKKIALASSSDKKQLTILNKIAQVEDVVDCETSADDIDSSKPDPDVFHAALKCLRQTKPDEAIAVGDTPYDAEGRSANTNL